jgi:hydroxyacyl-ACP dehydratase HTD2-like protein with hotdog domain
MDKSMLSWTDINEGYEIPELTKKPTYMQLFMFSAVTWNRHLIHYNTEFARNDGLPDVATHRALIGNFLAQLLSDWLGEAGKIIRVDWSVRQTAVPGDTLTCRGKVLQKCIEGTKKFAECEIWVENQKRDLIAPGKGEVMFFD